MSLSSIPIGAQQKAAIAQKVDVDNEPLGTVVLTETTHQHGLLHPEGAHAGDILNMRVPPSGAAGDRIACGVNRR